MRCNSQFNLTRASDVALKLISPSGTESLLLNEAGKSKDNNPEGDKTFNGSQTLQYTFNTALLEVKALWVNGSFRSIRHNNR
ncbi:proprotein convertase P-domain-containing protein [Gallibacterium anatis]|uniref:Proprotein convertase P-domain-containing protein n=1 Tax=Gallibacterium anatis TaxID=750 RepID=A0A930UWX6_9PAST|nr:proprotein convertase P-domain-containing protein [Gallibacterium anatis]